MRLTFTLPLPPSTNNLFSNFVPPGGGVRQVRRVPTKDYKAWQRRALEVLEPISRANGLIDGEFSMHVEAYRPRRNRDLDNVIKPIGDILKKAGLIKDDRHNTRLTAEWAGRGDKVIVTVEAA